jgi:hypothetical protein
MSPVVEAYAGGSYPEHPRAFTWAGKRWTVQEILTRRREPNGIGFTVRCAQDRALFDLFYDNGKDEWQIHPTQLPLNAQEKITKPPPQGA